MVDKLLLFNSIYGMQFPGFARNEVIEVCPQEFVDTLYAYFNWSISISSIFLSISNSISARTLSTPLFISNELLNVLPDR